MHAVHTSGDTAVELAGADLNLIVAFDALARELSVTRAALRVGITQSAMSHALRRLRDLLGDPLLVRGRGGMTLTPRAESLVVPLRSALVTIGRALADPDRFDPALARRAFRLASPDLFDVLAVPLLLERIRSKAPGVDITVVPLEERHLSDRLETGEVDVAIVPKMESRKTKLETNVSGLVQRTLFRDRFSSYLRSDHPALKKKRRRKAGARSRSPLTLATYASLSHALVSPSGEGRGFVDQLLADQGLTRRIVLQIPHFYSALAIVAKSDLILTAPAALGLTAPSGLRVTAFSPPLALPEHSINLVWHERFSNDPGHRWLRELVADVSRIVARSQ